MASGYFDDFYFAYQELNDLEGYDYYDEEHSESMHLIMMVKNKASTETLIEKGFWEVAKS